MKHKLSITAVTLLTASSLFALPDPIARWNADGDVQPEPGGKARTTNSVAITYKAGVAGKAFAFDGKTSEIETDLVLKSPEITTMTWSVWIRPTESAGEHIILSADPYSHAITITSGQLSIYCEGRHRPIAPIKWGVWQHVAVVFAADHATVYHRGGTATIPLRAAESSLNQKGLFIGGWVGNSSYYSGLIDEVAIYDRGLTQAEVAEIANGRNASKHPSETKPAEKSPAKQPQVWTNTEGKAITAQFVRVDGDQVVLKIDNKEFPSPFAKLAAASIQQAKELAAANRIPAAPTVLHAKVAGQEIKVERWGSGTKALVLFSHTGTMNQSVVGSISTYDPLFALGYSIFMWNYPNGKPFSEVQLVLGSWMNGTDQKVDFAGIATAVVDSIRTQTGIKEFLLLGDSLGAGILLSDYPKLAAGDNMRFVFISPTEPFSPDSKNLPTLKNSLLLANIKGDDFIRSPGFTKWIEGQKVDATLTGPLPLGHLILGENLPHERLVKVLADFLRQSPGGLPGK